MQRAALQWALDRPRELERAILVCASARLNAQNIALSAIARSAITEDPDFQHGDYLDGARATLMAGRRARGRARGRLSAAIGHALAFTTWRSLAVEQELDAAEAVELMQSLVASA